MSDITVSVLDPHGQRTERVVARGTTAGAPLADGRGAAAARVNGKLSGEQVSMGLDSFVEEVQRLVRSKSLENAGHLAKGNE